MINPSKSMAIFMASAALIACLSNPVSAMEHFNDDQDQGCCPRIKNAVIQRIASQVDDYVLKISYNKAINKLAPLIRKYCSENLSDERMPGLPPVDITSQMFSSYTGRYLKDLVNYNNISISESSSAARLIYSKAKVMFEENAGEHIKEQKNTLKSLAKSATLKYAEQTANYASVGIYTALSAMTYLVAGYESAAVVLGVGALDVVSSLVSDKAGYLKKSLKSTFYFDGIVKTVETHSVGVIDKLDAKTILKFYNTEVTPYQREKAGEFDLIVATQG